MATSPSLISLRERSPKDCIFKLTTAREYWPLKWRKHTEEGGLVNRVVLGTFFFWFSNVVLRNEFFSTANSKLNLAGRVHSVNEWCAMMAVGRTAISHGSTRTSFLSGQAQVGAGCSAIVCSAWQPPSPSLTVHQAPNRMSSTPKCFWSHHKLSGTLSPVHLQARWGEHSL